MDAGLVVVLAATGIFLLVPLALAWVSTDPRRWARVERVLGRDLPAGHDRVPAWLPWLAITTGVVYLLIGVGWLVAGGRRGLLGVLWMLQGVVGVAVGVVQQRELRRRRERSTASAEAEVEDRAEPGRPAAGG